MIVIKNKYANERMIYMKATYNTMISKQYGRMMALLLIVAMVIGMCPTVLADDDYYCAAAPGLTLVESLENVGAPSDFPSRAQLAVANGIVTNVDDYLGSQEQNLEMLTLIREGKLKKASSESSSFASTSTPSGSGTAETDTYTIPGAYKNAVTVTKDNAALRTDANEKASIAFRAPKGTVLEYSGTRTTSFLNRNKWYIISYNGETYYLFSGNAEVHVHKWEDQFSFESETYKICNCGYIQVSHITKERISIVKSAAAAAIPVATGLAVADGPLPVGDIVAGVVLVAAAATAYNVTIPDTSYVEVITDEAFTDYLKNEGSKCTEFSFRRVMRVGGKLKYMDEYCMDMAEAYVCARYLGIDVYTKSEDAAMIMVATFFGSGICERDKDKETYFYHYHFGTDRNIKVHVFFGANDFGETPT